MHEKEERPRDEGAGQPRSPAERQAVVEGARDRGRKKRDGDERERNRGGHQAARAENVEFGDIQDREDQVRDKDERGHAVANEKRGAEERTVEHPEGSTSRPADEEPEERGVGPEERADRVDEERDADQREDAVEERER